MQDPTTHPVRLFIGQQHHIEQEAIYFAQQRLCVTQTCQQQVTSLCNSCALIQRRQHWQVKIVAPQKGSYVLAEMADIIQFLSFKLAPEERACLIIKEAHMLTPACANSLLKKLEEVVLGYTIILLADHVHALLPTVVSRCLVQHFVAAGEQDGSAAESNDAFATLFHPGAAYDPALCAQLLDTVDLTTNNVVRIIDLVMDHALHILASGRQEDEVLQKKALNLLDVLIKAKTQVPLVPASSKIFFKNLYLQLFR